MGLICQALPRESMDDSLRDRAGDRPPAHIRALTSRLQGFHGESPPVVFGRIVPWGPSRPLVVYTTDTPVPGQLVPRALKALKPLDGVHHVSLALGLNPRGNPWFLGLSGDN